MSRELKFFSPSQEYSFPSTSSVLRVSSPRKANLIIDNQIDKMNNKIKTVSKDYKNLKLNVANLKENIKSIIEATPKFNEQFLKAICQVSSSIVSLYELKGEINNIIRNILGATKRFPNLGLLQQEIGTLERNINTLEIYQQNILIFAANLYAILKRSLQLQTLILAKPADKDSVSLTTARMFIVIYKDMPFKKGVKPTNKQFIGLAKKLIATSEVIGKEQKGILQKEQKLLRSKEYEWNEQDTSFEEENLSGELKAEVERIGSQAMINMAKKEKISQFSPRPKRRQEINEEEETFSNRPASR